MKKIILSGCSGKMGRVVANIIENRQDCEIVAGVDIHAIDASFPVYSSPEQCPSADVIIDFSHPSCIVPLLNYARANKIPAVICTTGLGEEQLAAVHAAAEEIPVFFSANMSLGVNLMAELCKKAASLLGADFDVEIIEKHHNQKIDAPSGTALMLADAVASALPHPSLYEYDRYSRRQKRDKNEIGIHAVRGGTIVGEHEVIFAGRDEVLTISHSAASKEIFAVGAVNAAVFLADQPAGMYNMGSLVD
ncbi:MAG: 4-hydroxy-tetrahydrodipicolinate reductase [Oscillospiraceae bacterium]|nr:4-hydroxy-tetrahydrodipicolinate reductase [Oscillospiraceae bacterium]